jgi:hypothetical protein
MEMIFFATTYLNPRISALPVLICTCKWYGIIVPSQMNVRQMNESTSFVLFYFVSSKLLYV